MKAETSPGALPNRVAGSLPSDSDTNPDQSPVITDAAVKACQDQAKARGNNAVHGASAGAFSAAVTEQQDSTGHSTFGKFYGWFSALKNFGSGGRWLSLIGSIRYVYDNPGDELDMALRARAGGNDLGISVMVLGRPISMRAAAFTARPVSSESTAS